MSKPMNPNDQILTASDAELPKMLGAVLQPIPSYHEWRYGMHDWEHFEDNHCVKCNVRYKQKRGRGCPSPDPIPLTWNVAMTWRDWAVEECGDRSFHQALYEVLRTTEYNCDKVDMAFSRWTASYTQPKHCLIAAALCKIKINK